jgi:hypothetical protein
MRIITTIILIVAFNTVKSQVIFDRPIPCIYWMSDTSTYLSSGNFKTSTPFLKRKGYVVYTKNCCGDILYSYLDINLRTLDRKYMVLMDDRKSEFINYKPTVFPNAIVRQGETVDTVYTPKF